MRDFQSEVCLRNILDAKFKSPWWISIGNVITLEKGEGNQGPQPKIFSAKEQETNKFFLLETKKILEQPEFSQVPLCLKTELFIADLNLKSLLERLYCSLLIKGEQLGSKTWQSDW